jgi:2,3-bisphosphoglycerate-independent phosphoglycerate mutase
VDKDFHPTLSNGKLGDVSPTILKLMGVDQPKEMTGVALF